MQIPLPFGAPLYGIQCLGGILRVAMFRRHGWKESLIKVWEKEISPKIIALDGSIIAPQKCAQLIRDNILRHRLPLKGDIAFLLPSEKVYTHLFSLQVEKQDVDKVLKSEISKIIPDEEGDLTIISKSVATTPNATHVAVAAIRTDILQGYIDTAQAIGLSIDRATIPAASIASFTKASRSTKTFLFLSLPSGKDEKKGVLTVFYQNWPIDELPLPQGCTEQHAIALARELAQEYTAKGFPPERLVLWADPSLEEGLRKEAKKEGICALPEIERALPWLKDRNIVWGAIQATCIAQRKKLPINFASPERQNKLIKQGAQIVGATISALLIGLIVLWFFS